MGLAGFAGVAAAFGGRDRSYNPVERLRLGALFGIAAIPLGGSLLAISLMSAGLTAQFSYLCVSSVGLLSFIEENYGVSIREVALVGSLVSVHALAEHILSECQAASQSEAQD